MRGAERVIGALSAAGKTGKPPWLTEAADAVPTPCQDFMRIGLMADIPDDLIIRRIENRMHGDGQFHDAKRGPQMTPGR